MTDRTLNPFLDPVTCTCAKACFSGHGRPRFDTGERRHET